MPRRADVPMASKHQKQKLRRAPLFLTGQITPQRIRPKRVSLRIFPEPLQEFGVGAQEDPGRFAISQWSPRTG